MAPIHVWAESRGYRHRMAPRTCPDCGKTLTLTIDHVEWLPDEPTIATPRWDCESCGWSTTTSE